MARTVLVSGGSGYIAGFLIQRLIAEGWTVKTTVRSLAGEQAVRDALKVDDAKLSFFGADLVDDNGWAEATAECSHVAHVASPFPSDAPKSEEAIIAPARDGALRVLRFAHAAGVKRFVLTSSVAAIAYGHSDIGRVYTEADWTDPNAADVNPYIKSKAIAERAAREWMAVNGAGMEFCTINPSAVLGPLLSDDFSTSIQFVQRLLDGSVPGIPRVGFAVVDVRDLADLHVRALNAPGIDGERFIAAGAFYWMGDVARVLRTRLGQNARKVPTRKVPDFVVRLLAIFDGSIRQVVGELGRTRAMDPSHTREVLGWETRSPEDSIVDTARSLIDHGIVKI